MGSSSEAGTSIFSRARSVEGSVPSTFAVAVRPSASSTVTPVAPLTTWSLVRTWPWSSMTTPLALPGCGPVVVMETTPERRRAYTALKSTAWADPDGVAVVEAGVVSTTVAGVLAAGAVAASTAATTPPPTAAAVRATAAVRARRPLTAWRNRRGGMAVLGDAVSGRAGGPGVA